MTIPPVYWSLLGELALLLIGVLCSVIVVILKDRKKLREYSEYLKDVIKKLKKKLKEKEEQESGERVLELLKAIIAHVHQCYQSQYGNEIVSVDAADNGDIDDKISVEKFILISGYQTMLAQLTALENSNEPELAWEKITSEITPLIQNYLNLPAQSATDATQENLQQHLDNAIQRIENLEKFKQLYFELQNKMGKSVEEIEALNHQISKLAEGSANYDDIISVIEKNKTHYINMGQMIGMDTERHHASVADKMDYSDELMNERKDEIKRLKSQISRQFEEMWKLQNSLSNKPGQTANPEQLNATIETYARQLKDSELCIETMDMEIQTLMSEIGNLKNKVNELESSGNGKVSEREQEKDNMIARFAQESKELMSCITGLEDNNAEQLGKIKTLEEKLQASQSLQEKHARLEAKYASMEAKYLEAMSK